MHANVQRLYARADILLCALQFDFFVCSYIFTPLRRSHGAQPLSTAAAAAACAATR